MEFEIVLGLRARGMYYGLRTDPGLPPEYAPDRIAELRRVPGPANVCIRPICRWVGEKTISR
eukprot:9112873-Alexandrium_andersonii.AAC.1